MKSFIFNRSGLTALLVAVFVIVPVSFSSARDNCSRIPSIPKLGTKHQEGIESLILGGVGNTGGGDEFTYDFLFTANQIIYPWLKSNGHKLNPKVDAEAFLKALDPKSLVSVQEVYESCDEKKSGRPVSACYNARTGQILLSRDRYITDNFSPSKIGLVSHEIFRKMGIEGDNYEVTKQIAIAKIPPNIFYAEYFDCDLESSDSPYYKVQRFIVSMEADLMKGQEIDALFIKTQTTFSRMEIESALYSGSQVPALGNFGTLVVNKDSRILKYEFTQDNYGIIKATKELIERGVTYREVYQCKAVQ